MAIRTVTLHNHLAYRPRREIHTLSHQVATHTSAFADDALSNRLDRSSTALLSGRHADDLVVEDGGHVELEEVDVLGKYVLGNALGALPQKR